MLINSVLLASPVNKNIKILREFLNSITQLECSECDISYCFVDDNNDSEASEALCDFVDSHSNAELLEVKCEKNTDFDKDDHVWSFRKIEKVAYIKNSIIRHFLCKEYSHLFLIDSDLIIHPKTLQALLSSDKDIVANIFWTEWQKGTAPFPQVWLKDFYTLYDDHMLMPRTQEQINIEKLKFLHRLKVPGVYKVGGLGACTLIRRKVLEAGVNFDSLYNISFWGEDRSFCIRAVAYGFELYVNTFHPAFHIYRMEDLDELPEWYDKGVTAASSYGN